MESNYNHIIFTNIHFMANRRHTFQDIGFKKVSNTFRKTKTT